MVKRFGGVGAGGIERRKVVEVPSDSKASPGADSDMTVAGLSPVNGATIHSKEYRIRTRVLANKLVPSPLTRTESPPLYPPSTHSSDRDATKNRFLSQLFAKGGTTANLEDFIIPFVSDDIHQVHATRIRDVHRGDLADKHRGYKGRYERNMGSRIIDVRV